MGLFRKKKKSESLKNITMDAMSGEFAATYFVKLLFKESVEIQGDAVQKTLEKEFGTIDVISEQENRRTYALCNYPVSDGKRKQMPSQVALQEVIPFDKSMVNDMALSQCWRLKNASALLDSCAYELTIHDGMATGHTRLQRCDLIARFVDVMLELFPQCIALYFPHAHRFMSREQFQQTRWKDEENHFLDGGLSIRFFELENSEDVIVDTVGLCAIGGCDIQCHFHGLDIDDVINYVGNLACFLYHIGDIIQDGDIVNGILDHEEWICQHEVALMEPKRVVLDVNMLEYAANQGRN